MRAISVLHERDKLVSYLTCNNRIVLVLKPLLEELLDFVRSLVAVEALCHDFCDSLSYAVRTEFHTETELAEVLEEGVGPSRTVTFSIGAIWRCRE